MKYYKAASKKLLQLLTEHDHPFKTWLFSLTWQPRNAIVILFILTYIMYFNSFKKRQQENKFGDVTILSKVRFQFTNFRIVYKHMLD